MNDIEWTRLTEQEIYQYLHDENGDIDPTLQQYMAISLGRVLSKNTASDGRRRPADTEIYHISDWLIAAVRNNEPWLQNVDDQGRPKKLMKFSTVEQIVAEADKAMLKAAQKGREIQLDESQEKAIETLEDGYTIVELLSAEALDRESAYMQHCIGNGGYDHKVGSLHFKYLSLRDANNKPHVTMELMSDEKGAWNILQFQGKQNKLPLQRYVSTLVPFFRGANLKLDKRLQENIPYVIDAHGQWYDLENLPSRLFCHTFRPLPYPDRNSMTRLKMPEFLSVFGKADIRFKNLDGFPSKIVFGNPSDKKEIRLELTCVEIDNMPDAIHIGGKVNFHFVTFKSSPDHISVDGDCTISFQNCSKTPKQITATGNILLASITERILDARIYADGDVTFWNCDKMKTITHGIETKGRLSFFRSDIKELPDGINVRELLLSQTNIVSLPEGIKVSGKLILDNQVFFEHIPDSINDDVAIEWKDSHKGPVLEDEDGPATVGEWRALQHQMRM